MKWSINAAELTSHELWLELNTISTLKSLIVSGPVVLGQLIGERIPVTGIKLVRVSQSHR
jgi:hypothetical protein